MCKKIHVAVFGARSKRSLISSHGALGNCGTRFSIFVQGTPERDGAYIRAVGERLLDDGAVGFIPFHLGCDRRVLARITSDFYLHVWIVL